MENAAWKPPRRDLEQILGQILGYYCMLGYCILGYSEIFSWEGLESAGMGVVESPVLEGLKMCGCGT